MSTTIPTTQNALYLLSPKGAWSVGPNDVPTPNQDEVLIRIEAAALNPVDWKIQAYGLFIEKFPAVLGTDSAGIVKEVGEGVTGFSVGDRV